MQITVKLYGNLKKYLPEKREITQMEIEPGTTIQTLLSRLGVPDTEVWMSAINDNVVDESSVLHEGDVLEVFEPVGGGCKSSQEETHLHLHRTVPCDDPGIHSLRSGHACVPARASVCEGEQGCLVPYETRNFIDA